MGLLQHCSYWFLVVLLIFQSKKNFQVNEDDDQHDPPQLSVKPEFSLGKVKPGGGGPFGGPPSTPGPRERVGSTVESEDEGEGSTSNLLDCLVQVQFYYYYTR